MHYPAVLAPLSLLPTIVLAGGFAYYSWSTARREDEEEEVRIKDETEKMERLSKEFTDIDESVTVDEDLMSSLKKRLNATETKGSGGGADDEPSGGTPPSGSGGGAGGSDSGGGAAVREPPDSSAADVDPPEEPGTSAEDIARLNRLFGSPDAEK